VLSSEGEGTAHAAAVCHIGGEVFLRRPCQRAAARLIHSTSAVRFDDDDGGSGGDEDVGGTSSNAQGPHAP